MATGDALYCQRDLCRRIVQADGDYLFIVKTNQPALARAIATLFVHPPPGESFTTAITWDKHGDRVETRRLWASSALAAYLDWPGLQQVALVERICRRHGARTRQVRAVITSLGAETTAATLLARVRGHGAIENRLHWVRDVTMGEAASQVRRGAAPQVLAALRNTVLALVRRAGWTNIAAALRHYAWRPAAALALFGLSP